MDFDTGFANTLRREGFGEGQIAEMIGGMENEMGHSATLSASQHLLMDSLTGHIRLTKAGEQLYRPMFGRIGLRIEECLKSRQFFVKCLREANAAEFDRLACAKRPQKP